MLNADPGSMPHKFSSWHHFLFFLQHFKNVGYPLHFKQTRLYQMPGFYCSQDVPKFDELISSETNYVSRHLLIY